MDNIISYYNRYTEEDRLTQRNTNILEFETTKYLLKDYIKENSTILETGAGTGIYSFYFSGLGHEVLATDLVPRHVELMKDKALKDNVKNLTVDLLDATDLSLLPDDSFDTVLCLGPMYHLTREQDQKRCIEEGLRVLKKDGILAVAYINKHYILSSLLLKENRFLNKKFIDKILLEGQLKEEDGYNFWTDSCFYTPCEIEELMSNFNIEKLENAATDGLGRLLPEKVNSLSLEEFSIFLDYHLKTCREKSLVGYSNHALFIGRKTL